MALNIVLAVALIGLLGFIAAIAFLIGALKSYPKIKPYGFAWVSACLVFIFINKVFLESRVLATLLRKIPVANEDKNLILVLIVLTVLAFVAAAIFGLISFANKVSFRLKLKKAEKLEELEAVGEEVVFDENKEYKPLPFKGKKKPRIISRIFGGFSKVANSVMAALTIISIGAFIVYATPLTNVALIGSLYAQGPMGALWGFIQKYALDFAIIGFVIYMVKKGWQHGFLETVRKMVVAIAYFVSVFGPYALMFSPLSMTGGKFAFLGDFAKALAHPIMSISMPATASALLSVCLIPVFRSVIAFALMIFFVLLTTGANWLIKKFVDYVDDSIIWSKVEKVLAAVIFFQFALAIVCVLMSVMYTFTYYNVFDCGMFFRVYSPISSAFYNFCGSKLLVLFNFVSSATVKASEIFNASFEWLKGLVADWWNSLPIK